MPRWGGGEQEYYFLWEHCVLCCVALICCRGPKLSAVFHVFCARVCHKGGMQWLAHNIEVLQYVDELCLSYGESSWSHEHPSNWYTTQTPLYLLDYVMTHTNILSPFAVQAQPNPARSCCNYVFITFCWDFDLWLLLYPWFLTAKHIADTNLLVVCSKVSAKLGGDTLKCITFAAPPVVSKDLAMECSDYITSVVCQDDLVPRASLANFEDLRKEIISCNWEKELKIQVRFRNCSSIPKSHL